MWLFLLFVIVLTFVTGAGVYFSVPYWLPAISGSSGQIDQAKLLEMLKVVPAAIAAIIASIIAGTTSALVVRLQLGANKRLESHKTRLIEELDYKKNQFLEELQNKKYELDKDLERERIILNLTKEEIEHRLELLGNAQQVATDYRVALGVLQTGELRLKAMQSLEPQIAQIRDKLYPQTPLYSAWCNFHQQGVFLRGRAQQLRRPEEKRNLWTEPDQKTGEPLGKMFGFLAEEVLRLLRAEREELTKPLGLPVQ
jgi:hypothetical protein